MISLSFLGKFSNMQLIFDKEDELPNKYIFNFYRRKSLQIIQCVSSFQLKK